MFTICDLCKGLLEKPKLNNNGHGYNACLKCQERKRILRYRRMRKLKLLNK